MSLAGYLTTLTCFLAYKIGIIFTTNKGYCPSKTEWNLCIQCLAVSDSRQVSLFPTEVPQI